MTKNLYFLFHSFPFRLNRSSNLVGFVILLFLVVFLSSFSSPLERDIKTNKTKDPLPFTAFPVNVIIEGVGSFELDILYTDNGLLFINIKDLFRTLKIPCTDAVKGISLEGFIGNQHEPYSIDFGKGIIRVGTRIIETQDQLLKESGALYMEASLFEKYLGLTLDFNFRSLTIKLKADFELPIIKEIRLEKMRANIAKIKGEVVVDTLINRDYHLFKFGTLDWAAASFQNWKGTTSNLIGLSVGAELLYGEANIALNYNDTYKFDNRQLNYLWRWIDNDKTFIKQAHVGKINVSTISFINAPIVGATIRNSPTTLRKAKGSYIINEITEPNWTVELYINNVLVDYTIADSSGSFLFRVPIVYGFTSLILKYYGPTGEERTEERELNVPYTVMPVNEFEYGISAGVVQDRRGSRFGKGEFNYGVNRILTVGGGIEYLSALPNSTLIPFATATAQPFSKLTLNGEYIHGVRSKGLLIYSITRDVLLELDYSKYVAGQKVTLFNASEERKAKLSVPFRYKKLSGFFRLDYSQLVYDSFNYNFSNLMFSAYYQQFNANVSTQINWVNQQKSYMTNDLALAYRFKGSNTFRLSARYNANDAKVISYRTELEKRIEKGYFSVSFESNRLSKDYFFNISCKYDFSFAKSSVSASRSKKNSTTSISVQGSMAFGGGNGSVYSSMNSAVGKGGIILYPFLDLNQNGIFDKEEHLVSITALKVNGASAIFNKKDSLVRIPNLNAFTSYVIEFDDNTLENIAWSFQNKTYQVLVDPNQFKRIDIPILPMGEISGKVSINEENSLKGIGRILIKIYKKGGDKIVAETLSESDGYIYKLGLKPGEYRACIDPEQLTNLDFIVDLPYRYFTIKTSEEGDIVDGLDFVLRKKENLPQIKE